MIEEEEEVINISNVTKPTVVSISDALTEMEQLHGIGMKKTHHKPSAPEYMVNAEELAQYKVLRDEIRKAKRELE